MIMWNRGKENWDKQQYNIWLQRIFKTGNSTFNKRYLNLEKVSCLRSSDSYYLYSILQRLYKLKFIINNGLLALLRVLKALIVYVGLTSCVPTMYINYTDDITFYLWSISRRYVK